MVGTILIEHKTNNAKLNEVNEKRTMRNAIMKRKIILIGHLPSCNQFITVITKEKINGKRINGRPRKSFLEEIF